MSREQDSKNERINDPWLDMYELEPYIFYKAIKLGYRVCEAPVTKIYPPKEIGYTKMAPITATPAVWPRVRVMAKKPEAMPSRSLLTDPIMALLFGERNIPKPTPSGAIRKIEPNAEVSVCRVLRIKKIET